MRLRAALILLVFAFFMIVSPGFAEIIINYPNQTNTNNYQNNNQYANYSNNGQQTEVDLYTYMNDLDSRIKQNWHAKMLSNAYKIVVYLKISKEGKLLSSSVLLSSRNQEADMAALRAVNDTPIYPLPKGYNKDFIEIQFTFVYNPTGATPSAQYYNRSDIKQNNNNFHYQTYDEWYKEHKKARKRK